MMNLISFLQSDVKIPMSEGFSVTTNIYPHYRYFFTPFKLHFLRGRPHIVEGNRKWTTISSTV